jgi:hypothetical protein
MGTKFQLARLFAPGWPRGGVPGTGQSFADTSIAARLRSSAIQVRGPRPRPADTMGTKFQLARLFAPGWPRGGVPGTDKSFRGHQEHSPAPVERHPGARPEVAAR